MYIYTHIDREKRNLNLVDFEFAKIYYHKLGALSSSSQILLVGCLSLPGFPQASETRVRTGEGKWRGVALDNKVFGGNEISDFL